MREKLQGLFLYIQVKWYLFCEERWLKREYPLFQGCNTLFKRAYLFSNPYRMVRTGDIYGETPLASLKRIASECELTQQDYLIDLGCGRGRGAYFLHHISGCRVKGIDRVPQFIKKARWIADRLEISHVDFVCEEMEKSSFSDATVVYLYGTCLSEEAIQTLIHRFQSLPNHATVITVSYPLSDYTKSFATVKQFTVSFPWGEGDVFLNVKNAP
jgi:SAM-dependent methyltransferase